MATEVRAKATPPSPVSAIGLFGVGAYLFAGAYYGFSHAKWPFFMPPQLDVFGFIFDLFGERVGGYVGAGFLGALGLALVALGISILVKRDA
ncbi:MAG: hypothetical protein KIS62_08605 [Ramlibacter sp.]|nr:hypothetical protein [Ramlibacter sp.]